MNSTPEPQTAAVPESARALLWRHGLLEDVIDGALCLHAQELAAWQRNAHDTTRPYFHSGLPCQPEYDCHVRKVIDTIDPTRADVPEADPESAAVPPAQERRDRYAQAVRRQAETGNVRYEAIADAVLAVADAEQADMRERHKASLRRADELNNQLMEEVQRYADGTERPVLWSVYNEMHKRAITAETRAEAMERAMQSTAADALRHGGCHRKLMAQCQRAEKAEAAIERVLAFAASLDEIGRNLAGPEAVHPVAEHIRHQLAEPADDPAAVLPQPETQATLAPLFEGFGRLLATSSRDWGQYAPDAWLYAVILGWDCEQEHEHDGLCDQGAAMAEMALRHGWDHGTVAKARRYRAAVRAITAPAVVSQPDEEAGRIVAYRSPQARSLYCVRHRGELFGAVFTPVTSEDLPDGGLCTFPDCGVDVLIPQQPDEEAHGPRTVCICGHTRGEHLRVSGRLLCDECVPDSTDNLVCKEFEAL